MTKAWGALSFLALLCGCASGMRAPDCVPSGRVEKVSTEGAWLDCQRVGHETLLSLYRRAGASEAARLQEEVIDEREQGEMRALLWKIGGALAGGGVGVAADCHTCGAASGMGALLLGVIGWGLGDIVGSVHIDHSVLAKARAAADAYNKAYAKPAAP